MSVHTNGEGGQDAADQDAVPVGIIAWLVRAWKAAQRAHFRISRPRFLLLGIAGTTLVLLRPYEAELSSPPILGTGWTLVAISAAGLLRWWQVSHPQPILAVCTFSQPGQTEATEDTQARIVTHLRENLPSRFRVVSIPEPVGTDERDRAAILWARLRTVYLLFGSIRTSGEIDPRLLRPTHRYLVHEDVHTRDRTPQRTPIRTLADRLTGSNPDELQYPFTTEVEVVVRGLEGRLLLLLDQAERAEAALQQAIQASGNSSSQALDDIRLALAEALDDQHKHDEALALLVRRADDGSASPDLLRTLAARLVRGTEIPTEEDRKAAIQLLRQAYERRGDPLRDVTVYNLAKLLMMQDATREEGWQMLQELTAFRRSPYRRAWYVARDWGGERFHRFIERSEEGDELAARQAAKEAVRWYGRAIRRRPRMYLERTGPRGWNVRLGAPPSPILLANLVDAHGTAKHPWRRAVRDWHLRRVRARFMRKARRHAIAEDWAGAYKFLEWIWVGRGDYLDVVSRVGAALAAERWGREDLSQTRLREAERLEPHNEHLLELWTDLAAWLNTDENSSE